MKIRFELRQYKIQKVQPVFMVLTAGRTKRIKIVVPNVKIHPNQWNEKEQRVKDIKSILTRNEINAILNKMQSTAQKVIDDVLQHTPPLTYDKVNEKIRAIYPNKRTPKGQVKEIKIVETDEKITFWQFVETFMKDLTNRVGENGKLTNLQTVKNYTSAKNCLKEFEVKYNKNLDFDSFDVPFIMEYKTYLTTERQQKPNTISKKINTLKILLEAAYEKDLHNNTAYKTKKEFKMKSENVDNIYMTEKELTIIENHDFSANEKLDNVRDWFLIGCWTGLRYSDYSKLKKELVSEKYQITIEQQKTGQKVTVSLNVTDTIPHILAKRNGNFPKLITNQKFNQYVKEVLEIVGINDLTVIYETIGGKKVRNEGKKYEYVTAHTARRSFATNLYLRDVSISRIMAATGHKSESEFMKYVKASQVERQGNLREAMDKGKK